MARLQVYNSNVGCLNLLRANYCDSIYTKAFQHFLKLFNNSSSGPKTLCFLVIMGNYFEGKFFWIFLDKHAGVKEIDSDKPKKFYGESKKKLFRPFWFSGIIFFILHLGLKKTSL